MCLFFVVVACKTEDFLLTINFYSWIYFYNNIFFVAGIFLLLFSSHNNTIHNESHCVYVEWRSFLFCFFLINIYFVFFSVWRFLPFFSHKYLYHFVVVVAFWVFLLFPWILAKILHLWWLWISANSVHLWNNLERTQGGNFD